MATTSGNMKSFKVTDKDGNIFVMTPVDTEARQAIDEAKNLYFDEDYFTSELSQDETEVSVGLNGVPIGVDTDTPLEFVQDDENGIVLGSKAPFATTIADEFATSSTYDLNDKIMHKGNLYICTSAISTTGNDWNIGNWSATNVNDIVAGASLIAGDTIKISNGIIDVKNNACSSDATSLALGDKSQASGNYSLCYGLADEDKPNIASGHYCINLGWHSSAIGNYSTVIGGNYCLASGSYGNNNIQHWGPIAQGLYTSSMGQYTHAEGQRAFASGTASHAEGDLCVSIGNCSHAEGNATYSIGNRSHSEGSGTSACGVCSHSEGLHTIVSADYSLVIGKYNYINSAIFVIGNGNYDAENDIETRSDVFVADENGVTATKLATSGIADVESEITALSAQLGNIETALNAIINGNNS